MNSSSEAPSDSQDDPPDATDTHGRFLSFRHPGTGVEDGDLTKYTVSPNLTMAEASRYILTHTPSSFQRMIQTNYSYGFETDEEQLKANDRDHRKVSERKSGERSRSQAVDQPTRDSVSHKRMESFRENTDASLPNAPSMKIYCLYGHGKETEVSAGEKTAGCHADIKRSYWYMQGEYEQDESRSDAVDEEAFVSIERGTLRC